MPALDEISNNDPIKLMIMGESGTGKTGSLVALALAGFKLRILDFDKGVEILTAKLRETPEGRLAMKNIDVVTVVDKKKGVAGKILPVGKPEAFSRALSHLDHWKQGKAGEPGSYDLGKPSTWGKDTIIVVDSQTHMSNAAFLHVLQLNGRAGDQPWQSDWGNAMDLVEGVLSILYSDSIGCHVIVTSHITYIGTGENGDENVKAYPQALGKKLPPKIPTYFNTILQADRKGTGDNAKRILLTKPKGQISVKCPWLKLPAELPLETGLVQLFAEALQGEMPTPVKVGPSAPTLALPNPTPKEPNS